jgi:hypothetical protein
MFSKKVGLAILFLMINQLDLKRPDCRIILSNPATLAYALGPIALRPHLSVS